MAGDGNGDGTRDSEQSSVSSIRISVSTSKEDDSDDTPASTYTTLVAGSENGKPSADHGTRIAHLEQKKIPPNLPRALEALGGLTSFQVELTPGTHTESFSLYVDPAQHANGYWLRDRTGTWVNLASEPYSGKVVRDGQSLRLDFRIEDGGAFDADGETDGIITAPGTAAHMLLSIVGQASDAQAHEVWF
ncbi:choice-of-anchor U domain-containing protein [Verminephrobacter aporrectodeae]|uniref:choice-of-anchor U domain-containing protein n=1 Tax=Verminephrobacter aporrectodeae TaxID=1110389 RepID=UPI002AA2B4DB|nr:choice-of-anchor U domain-containing protein [Verminephrobacter aporrectodeae]